jgi:myosin-1
MARKGRLGAKNALDDLVMLQTISEDAILDTLKNRYAQDSIYTSIGPVLVAINPFKMISGLYTDATIREYRGKKYFELPPHVYSLADETYSSMISYRENQCVIISGESGSGKTETSKIIMQYISGVSGKSAEVVRVKERMLSSNPVLEGFGNAKTVNNNNSSRFGKYMEVLFDYAGDPVGGRVTNYLLEKSRVVGPAVGERNFHAFYQVCKGASAGDRETYCIEGVEYYYYLSQTECYDVQGIDDVSDYKEMVEALKVIGLSDEEIGEVHRVISAILWLGNVAFTEDNQEKSSVQDPQVLEIVSHLLQVDVAVLTEALCQRQLQTGSGAKAEIYKKPNTASQADFCRDTMSKALYSAMFDWLVRKVNESIHVDSHEGVHIGILDIYGFEIFEYNSFEQLCINYVNEQLQQIFIELTLKAEQEEYTAEGIPWTPIKYYNNKPVCDLISGKPGVLSICDDCCNTAKTDMMFCQDLQSLFGGSNILHVNSADFTVRHYAGDVRYEATAFLIKNKDTLFDDLKIAIKASPCKFVKDHGWADMKIVEGQKQRPVTVGFQFRQQVTALMTALKACVPHYIRCIKPNMEKTPNNFNSKNTKRQVQYLGLLENVRVRRAGYAYRSEFARFVKRYSLLDHDVWIGKIQGGPRAQVSHLTGQLGWAEGKEYALGKTKIFIQDATTLFHLEDMLDRKMTEAVVVVQKAYRRYKQKRYYLQTRADAYDLVKGRKQRRRGSVDREYR